MALLFINKVPGDRAAYEKKLRSVSSMLGIDPDWLQFVINYETAGSFSASKKNPNGTATGLIQFLESTAKGLGTSTAELAKMTNVQQLDWVYKYLKNYKGLMVDYYTTYLAVFYPAALDEQDTWVFPSSAVNDNPSFFHTGTTLKDFKKGVDALVYSTGVPASYYDKFFKKKILFCRYIKERSLHGAQLSYC